MTRLQVRPVPHASHGVLALLRHDPRDGRPVHGVMRAAVRCLFDNNFTERDALETLDGMLLPEYSDAAGIAKLATEFGKLLAVIKESFHYQQMMRRRTNMSVLYVPMGGDYAILSTPYDVQEAFDVLRALGQVLADNDLVFRVEVPLGFNQLIADKAKGADTLLQEAVEAKLSGKQIPTAEDRGYTGQQAEVYADATQEIAMTLMHTYYNLIATGWYSYRVEYTSDWEFVIIFTRTHAKLELVKPDSEPDEKEPA